MSLDTTMLSTVGTDLLNEFKIDPRLYDLREGIASKYIDVSKPPYTTFITGPSSYAVEELREVGPIDDKKGWGFSYYRTLVDTYIDGILDSEDFWKEKKYVRTNVGS